VHRIIVEARPFVEFLYFLVGIALAIGLYLTRSQLLEMRRDSRTRSQRSSKEKAIEASTRYLENYVRLTNEYYRKSKEKGLKSYRGRVGDFTFESLSPESVSGASDKLEGGDVAAPLNELELIASVFVTGVADERTGFKIIGRSFVATVEAHYDVITILRVEESGQPYWYNIVELYNLWSNRLRRADLSSNLVKLQENLNALSKDEFIPPVGCEDVASERN
jgi:hypothetical protein